MVERITSQTQRRNSLSNIFRITEDIFQLQAQIASQRRIQKPSDDPAGIRTSLALSTNLSRVTQFIRNIDNNKIFIQSADTALESIGLGLTRAKELAIAGLGGTATAQTRGFTAVEVGQIVSQVTEAGNTQVKNVFIFSGTNTRTTPFVVSASGAVYQGNTDEFTIEIAKDITVGITRPGSTVLATDLNPTLSTSTSLADLNGGSGVASGTFTITDRSGNSATISVASGATVSTLIAAIDAAGINVTAAINTAQNGITLTDTSSLITGALTIAEVSGGTTALDLGLLGNRDGNLEGTDLNPILTSSTLISQLNGGDGLTLGSVGIVNGAASGTLTLTSATTIGEVLSLINSGGFDVTASIASAGNTLRVASNNTTTVAVVNNLDTDTTAEDLGIGGGRNVFETLINLELALERDDSLGLIALLNNLDTGLDSVNESRAISGAVLRRVEATDLVHDQDIVDLGQQKADITDTDIVSALSQLTSLELALQVTLDTTARIIQPTLLNFLS